jgi:hypothetical protein
LGRVLAVEEGLLAMTTERLYILNDNGTAGIAPDEMHDYERAWLVEHGYLARVNERGEVELVTE